MHAKRGAVNTKVADNEVQIFGPFDKVPRQHKKKKKNRRCRPNIVVGGEDNATEKRWLGKATRDALVSHDQPRLAYGQPLTWQCFARERIVTASAHMRIASPVVAPLAHNTQ